MENPICTKCNEKGRTINCMACTKVNVYTGETYPNEEKDDNDYNDDN